MCVSNCEHVCYESLKVSEHNAAARVHNLRVGEEGVCARARVYTCVHVCVYLYL